MPAAQFKRVNLDLLYPPFLVKVLDMVAACNAEGAVYFAISGFRSPADQQTLFNQGRTVTHDKAGNPLKVVTHSRPWYSAHNYGIAIDFSRDKDANVENGLQPDWGDPAYDELGRQAPRFGLVWGGSWTMHDRPHVQWPGFVTSRELEQLRVIGDRRDPNSTLMLYRVWNALDAW